MIQRTILILYILILTSLYANANGIQADATNSELSWVDSQVNAILPPRKGISNNSINLLREPFIFAEVSKSAKMHVNGKHTSRVFRQSSLKLMMIMNSKALINGRWYKQHEKIRGYKISSIETSKVVLKRRNITKILSVQADNKNIKINMK